MKKTLLTVLLAATVVPFALAAPKKSSSKMLEADSYAEAQKKANELLASSLTKELIDYNVAVKWDGKLPSVTGGNTPLIKLP